MIDAEIRIRRAEAADVIDMPWGRLIWQVSASLHNSELLTVGRCLIKPGCANGRHYHPNCEEVLSVIRGRIVHTWNEHEVSMQEGDTIAIPAGIIHNARNVGDEMAEMAISFSSAYRESVAVES